MSSFTSSVYRVISRLLLAALGTFSIGSAHAADTIAPSVPTGLTGTVISRSAIALKWKASTDNVAVTGYYVYLNDAPLTTTTSTTFTHSGLTAGTTYNYRVSAFDAVPNHSAWTATPVAVTTTAADTTVPSVSITSPASGNVSGTVTLTANASDNVGVVGVQFKLNGANLGAEDTAAPYSVSWDTAALAVGSYTLTAVARDAAGNVTTSAPITVSKAPTPDTQAPTVPGGLTGAALSGTQVRLTWNASTDNVAVTGYYVYLNDAPLTTTTATTFTHSGLTPGATYNYRVSAFDAVPNHSAWTATPVAVTTTAADTTAPAVSLTSPASGSVNGTVTVTASASDNVGVAGVQFKLNGANLGAEDTTAPYSISWDTTALAAGTYTLTAVARDAAGNVTTSAPVTVSKAPAPDTQAPTVPGGLTGAALSGTQVRLTWNASTDNVGVTGYYVYLNDAPLTTTTATTFTHSGLTAGTTYNYRVSAFDAVPNHSAWTATPVAVTTTAADTTAPSVSITSPASGNVSGAVTLTANASDNVGVVGVQFKLNGANLGAEDTTAPYSISWDTTALAAGTYTLTAVARDAAGNVTTSAPVTVSKADTVAPSVPTGLTGTVLSGTQVRLTWNASTDNVGVTGYYVYLNDAPLTTTTATTFTHSGLTAGATYNYRVSAFDAVPNHSAWTATPVAVTTTAADTTAPAVSLTSPASGSVNGTVTVTASASDNVGVAGVQFKLNGANLGAEDTTAPYSISWDTTALAAGTYTLTAVARDAAGNVTTSAPVTVSKAPAPDTQAPTVPGGLTGAALSGTQVRLTWNASTDNVGVTGYYVYLNDAPLTTTTATTFTHSGLTAGATYNYRVSAFDAVPNHSAWTATPVAVTTTAAAPAPDTQAPSVPTGLTGTALSTTQIKLTWNASTDNVGVTGYYVYLNDAPLTTTTSTTFTHSGLTAGTTYNYRVSAFDAVPNHSAWTATPVAVATSGGTTGGTTGSTKFLPTFQVYYGGGPTLTSADTARLAKFDLLDMDRFRYSQIGGNTWAAIKALNPNVQIYVYQDGIEVNNQVDGSQAVSLNNVGRYNVSRGHSMGSLNGNNPGLFLLDAAGNRIYNQWFSNPGANNYYYLLDFGASAFQAYWVESAKADIIDQVYRADGIFTDLCVTFVAAAGESAAPAKYPTNTAWSSAMNSFSAGITAGVRAYGQKLWCNKGDTRSAEGTAAWVALDAAATPPDVLLEEGAFAVAWGAQVQFFPEADWKRQVDIMGTIRNSKIAMLSHTQLAPGQSGTDNYGKPVTYWQTLWYAMGSFLIGKNDTLNNSYFMFNGAGEYSKIWWHDEYDQIDLGRAIGTYRVTPVGGTNVYWREFERGYVYVNPTANNVTSVTLPVVARRLTHDTLTVAASLPVVSTISLNSHEAAILLK